MKEEEALELINGYTADSYESLDEIEQEITESYSQAIDSIKQNTRRSSYAFIAGAGAYYLANTYSADSAELTGFLFVAYGATALLKAGYHSTQAYQLHQQKKQIEDKEVDQVLEEEDSIEFAKKFL